MKTDKIEEAISLLDYVSSIKRGVTEILSPDLDKIAEEARDELTIICEESARLHRARYEIEGLACYEGYPPGMSDQRKLLEIAMLSKPNSPAAINLEKEGIR